jgi:ribosomal protein S12 methylthiotransferase
VKSARRARVMALQKSIVQRRQRERTGARVRVMVDGPSPESPLVLQGRLEGQAPDIDPVVYFDECDPSAFAPGTLVDALVRRARDYDLVVVPAGRAS